MGLGCRKRSDDTSSLLVGLCLAKPDVQTVLAVQGDVAAFEVGELGAAERAGEAEEQQRGVAALVHLVGPPLALATCDVDEVPDVGDEECCTLGAGSVAGGGVVAADAGEGGGDELVRRGCG